MMLKTLLEVLNLAYADYGNKDVDVAFVKGRAADFETEKLYCHNIGSITPIAEGEHANVVSIVIQSAE